MAKSFHLYIKLIVSAAFFLLGFSVWVDAAEIYGTVKNMQGEPLPFASVMVKGTTRGTTANAEGAFSIQLAPGKYTLQCMHVGYATEEQGVEVAEKRLEINFVLSVQGYILHEIVVGNQLEDPAYEIIRNAIKKRKEYQQPVDAFTCEVYLKGQLRMRNYPDKFLGIKVDFEDEDSAKNKIIYLSETFADYVVQHPGKSKITVTSTRVSGQQDSYGFGTPQLLDFYNNNVDVSRQLNPRGFISPIADNALNYYRYVYMGSFIEQDKIVNKIRVQPKRSFEPVFYGDINIIENEWRIHSVKLQLTKRSQLEMVDTLEVEQLYVPVNNDVWMVQSQVLKPYINMLGFSATGNFVTVFSNYNVNPSIPKKFFNNVFLKYDTASNKRDKAFWEENRPVPLMQDEQLDYLKKDSLEIVRKDPAYLDSLDRALNKAAPMALFTTGQNFYRQSKKINVHVPAVMNMVNFNTVEGFNLHFEPAITKTFANRNLLYVKPGLRYGFTNKHFNADIQTAYQLKNRAWALQVNGGKKVQQFNNNNPVREVISSLHTLLYGDNYFKIYESWYSTVFVRKEVAPGLTFIGGFDYQDRIPLENRSDLIWGKTMHLENRTPNYPTQLLSQNFERHQALQGTIQFSYVPGAKYIEVDGRKQMMGSKYPRVTLGYHKGLPVLGSDVDFDKWSLSTTGNILMALKGQLDFKWAASGFLRTNNVPVQDYAHVIGNRMGVASTYLNSFQLADYYRFSNTEKVFTQLYMEHHFNGFITNKIPLLKHYKINLVAGGNGLIMPGRSYGELFAGFENIFKIIRIDYVWGWGNDGFKNSALRVGINGSF